MRNQTQKRVSEKTQKRRSFGEKKYRVIFNYHKLRQSQPWPRLTTQLISYPNSKSPLTKPSFITSPTCIILFLKSTTKPFLIRCSNSSSPKGQPSNSSKDALTVMVGKEVEDLLSSERNRELVFGLDKASESVEKAQREGAEIERQQLKAKRLRNYVNQLESTASENVSWPVKLASISAIVGTLVSLQVPVARANDISEQLLPPAITFTSCALYGVIIRGAVEGIWMIFI